MRKILFRAKDKATGKWAYGNYYFEAKNKFSPHYITWNGTDALGNFGDRYHPVNNVIIDEATLGQFTGLCDKNGARIFEGDILGNLKFASNSRIDYLIKFGFHGFGIAVGDVSGDAEAYGFYMEPYGTLWGRESEPLLSTLIKDFEVIGNIFDNPELLEGV